MHADSEILRKAAQVLLNVAEKDWNEKTKPVVLLRALCRLEERGRDPAQQGYDGVDLAREMATIEDKKARVWVENGEEEARIAVRRHWATLEKKIWPTKNGADSVLQGRAREAGMNVYAEPEKIPGGGSKKPNLYRLRLCALKTEGKDIRDIMREPEQKDAPTVSLRVPQIEYFTEDVSVPRLLRWIPAEGLRTRSWPGAMALTMLSVSGILGLGLALVSAWLLVATPTTLAFLELAVSVGWLAFCLWLFFHRWVQLADDGVAKAPMFWQPISLYGDNVMEIRRDPASVESPIVHLVRYVADCPICGTENGRSAVRLESGRLEFFGRRIVGRCRHAPNAHIWSFDPVTRKGRCLR